MSGTYITNGKFDNLPYLDDVISGDQKEDYYRIRDTDKYVKYSWWLGNHIYILDKHGFIMEKETKELTDLLRGSLVDLCSIKTICNFVKNIDSK